MKIIISGGKGFIGSHLTNYFVKSGNEVIILTRGGSKLEGNPKFIHWEPDGTNNVKGIQNADAVINLAGYSIASKRWSSKVKKEMEESRINSTKTLVNSMQEWGTKTFISASAVGYYGFRGDETIDENGTPGSDFLSQLAVKWEQAALKSNVKNVSILRFGVVIGENGGILEKFLGPIKLGISKKIGSGKQWVSWIDVDDVIGIIEFIMNNNLSGVFNATSPNPLRNEDFIKTIAEIMGKKQYVSAPSFIIKIMLGELGESLILNGQKVVPERLLEKGYTFKYPELSKSIEKALKLQQ